MALVAPGVLLFPSALVGALVVPMGGELAFGAFQLGVILSTFNLGGAIVSHGVGGWIDRHGARAGVLVGGLLVGASSVGVAVLAREWIGLAFLLLVCGIGMSFAHPSSNRLLTVAVPKDRQGVAFGVKQAVLPIASGMAGLSVLLVQAGVDWRLMYGLSAVASLALVIAASRIAGDIVGPAPAQKRQPLAEVRALVLLSLAGLFSGGAVATFVGFVVHSSVTRGMSASAGGMILALGSAASVVVRILAGMAADRRSGGILVRVAQLLGLGALACIGAALAPDNASFVAACVIVAGAGWGIAGLYHFAVVRIEPESPARASAIAQVGLFIGAAIGPLSFGYVADFLSLEIAWLLMASWMACASLLVLAARHCFRRNQKPGRSGAG